ncbi:MAG: hypothetical protein ABI939_10290 [Anaerolineaceae bacterium]
MTEREAVAQAMAFFEATDDIILLHQALGEVAPRAKKMVAQFLGRGTEEAIPAPADLRPARQPASKEQAMRTLKITADFSLLQVLARTVGRRIEAAEIAASAEFPEGAHVIVPASPTFPPSGPSLGGSVEVTGTMLRVLLDNGETWSGPPSLARLG